MNEMASWFYMPSDTTGARVVHVKTTGHEEDHFTVVLIAQANGKNEIIHIVFKGKGTHMPYKTITGNILHCCAIQ